MDKDYLLLSWPRLLALPRRVMTMISIALQRAKSSAAS
jgi:hypothetical protein